MSKKQKKKERQSECVIPPPIPHEALSALVFKPDIEGADKIAAYVEGQSQGKTVIHAEKVMTEYVLGRQYDCWDVRQKKARFWVITPPTNLYLQRLFPSLNYALSFHIGVTARMMAQHTPNAGVLEQVMMADAWRRWEEAGEILNAAQEAEDFQSVGMRSRECLISMVRMLAKPAMVPEGAEVPQGANVVAWCTLIADHIAHGSSADKVRGYMKATSKAGWEFVNWLTHARSATQADAMLGHELTQHVLGVFGTAFLRHQQGIPDRCEACGSYRIGMWAGEAGVPKRPRCEACGRMKDEAVVN
jgi:hypothetical protein